jgi:hypothetical protein
MNFQSPIPPFTSLGQPVSPAGLPLPVSHSSVQLQQSAGHMLPPPPWCQLPGAIPVVPDSYLSQPHGMSPPPTPLHAPVATLGDQFNPLQALRTAHLAMPKAKKLKELLALPPTDPNELFTHRLLCRRGLALFVGPSGVGKSTFITQALIKWARGLNHFGFNPLKPLRCLIVQAENDEHDLREQFGSSVRSLKLTEDQLESVNERISIVTINSVVGDEFCEVLRRLIIDHRADLVVVDPALAYLGGDANSQVEVGRFLRRGIAPVLLETNSAAILVHHVAKPAFSRGGTSNRSDAYAGAGSAEFSNFSRLVFGVNPTDVPDHFELFLGKRGPRARWRDPEGNLITKRILRHSREAGELLWSEVSDDEFQALKASSDGGKHEPTLDEFVSLFPATADGDPKSALLSTVDIKERCRSKGWEVGGYAQLRDAAVERGDLDVIVGPSNSKLTGQRAIVARVRALQAHKTK